MAVIFSIYLIETPHACGFAERDVTGDRKAAAYQPQDNAGFHAAKHAPRRV